MGLPPEKPPPRAAFLFALQKALEQKGPALTRTHRLGKTARGFFGGDGSVEAGLRKAILLLDFNPIY
jgi:hypothetical protein